MAEFKLGRIRFVWKGAWTTATTYYKDDVVRFGGKVYLCQVGHVSMADFNTDLDISPSKWSLMSDGQRWTGDWTTDYRYEEGDLVKYGGSIYVCTNGHTSAATDALGLEANEPADWDTFVEGFEWKGDWTVDTRYKFNDIARYGGINYVCITGHTSAATVTLGLEPDLAKWQVFSQGQEYTGTWAPATRYKINDIVKWGSGLWICVTQHTSTVFPDDSANWSQYTKGFEYENAWYFSTQYQPGDVVSYGGNRYVAKTLNSNANPLTETSDWDLFSEGLSYQSSWASGTSYTIGQVVQYGGYNYLAITDSPSYNLTITSVNGTTDKFTTTDTSAIVSGMAVRFTGTTFGGVMPGARYFVKDITSSTEFTITDIYGGSVTFNAVSGSGSMTATVCAEPPNSTFWTDISRGMFWRGLWADDTEYNAGDVVRYNANAYICVLAHHSEGDDGSTIGAQGGGQALSRPDLDASGTYWNTLTVGSEISVLTTTGDMVYYGGAGPTRLPVGTEGQVLRVSAEGIPEWVTWGKVDHVYYVAPTGENRPYPDCGASLDKPWASVRYACQQVEKGCRNPQAAHLLEMNRVFIQREVTEWIKYQIANNISPFTTSFVYDDFKCERDVGFIVDRLVWDITHGGNLKTLAAALTYINALASADLLATVDDENGTGTYSKISSEGTQDVAAYTYMLTVIDAVLSNTAPTTVYQTVLADSTAIVSQYINTNYTAEPTVFQDVTSLVDIVITALSDQSAANLPGRLVPSNTIFVKTGSYQETLPIIVPAETALVGDEVRSVHVAPRLGTTPRKDSVYTVASMDRLATVVDAIIQGTAVTPSTGNIVSQDQQWPLSTSTVADLATLKLRAMKYNIDFRLGTINSFVYPDPTDYNTAYLTGYGDARTLILGNKEFFKAQVKAYIDANYPDLIYSRTSCLRDVGYIVDALVYDLTYGGNVMSVQAGLAYYQGVGSSLYIDSAELTATLASYNYLKSMFQAAAANTTIAPLQSTEDQFKNALLTTGSAASTFIGDCITEMIDIVTNGPSAETRTNPSTTWVASALTTASSTLSSATATIQSNTISWINSNYPTLVYDTVKCSRDVGYMLDAVRYDFMFNSNFQTLKAAYSYLRATATEVFDLGQKDATRAAWEYVRTQAIANVGGNTTAIARINDLFQAIDDIIYGGRNEGNVCQSEDRTVDWAVLQLERNRDFIIQELDAWMDYNYVNFNSFYNSTTCARDIGYIVDAVISDLATGSNFASSVAGESYYRIQAALVPGSQMMQTVAAVKEAKRLTGTYVTDSSLYSAVNAAFDNVLNILQNGLTAVPTYTWPDNGTSTTGVGGTVTDAALLQTNRATMITGIETYLSTTAPYSTVWAALTTDQKNACKRDVGYIIDAVTYDLQYGGTMQTTIAGSAYYSFGTLKIASGEKAATLAALTQLSTLMQSYTSSTNDATVNTKVLVVYNIINTGATEPMTYTMPSVSGESAAKIATHAAIAGGTATIKSTVTTYITSTFSSWTYNRTLCNRDTAEIVDALIWDLKYSSNYKTLLCSRWYANAVIGSHEEDMFYLRNGTGVRNMTLEGLDGDLTPENAYGTRRVTAGAYASLDPGWGPADFRTWIISRSPYVQNVCTFGNAAIGQKIDGHLHNGGNKSIVSNDFTQIISDGIGAWVTNDARAELVSVFTYYSHIGYLSENGGRIRGTNGNNSYGLFGSVAEGYDANETPIYCEVDNNAFRASVGSTLTNGIDYVYQLEYNNAGTDYTQVAWTISGGGAGAKVEQDDFRDGAVFQVRLLDNVDDSSLAPEAAGNFGGFGYVSNANTAQSGTTTSLTLAAVDDEISSAYVGMKLLITSGTGAGQYGIIASYSAGTKIANVNKESTGGSGWDHIVAGTPIVAPDASSTYIVEPAVSLTAPAYSSTARTLATAQTYSDVIYSPTYAIYTPVTGTTSGSGTSASFIVVRKGTKYSVVNILSAGTGYERLDTITLAGTSLGGASTTNDITVTITAVDTTGAITAFEFVGVGAGGKFAAVASGSRNVNTSTNGTTWTANTTALPSTSNWVALARGSLTVTETAGSFVVGRAYVITNLGNTVFTSIGASANLVGTYFIATGAGSGTGTASPVANHLVAVSNSTTVNAYSTDAGVTWTNGGALPVAMSGLTVDVAYGLYNGTGTWVAISSDGNSAYSTNGGISWSTGATLPTGTYTAIAYGQGRWIAVASGGTVTAYSDNGGQNWSAGGTLPASSTWVDIEYGANKFVAVSSDGSVSPAYSVNKGANWYNTNVAGWLNQTVTHIRYGQGVFVATNSTSNNMVSSEDGINWTTRSVTRASGTGILRAVHGNPNQTGIWAIIPSASTTAASSAIIGATAKARAYVSSNKIYAIRVTDPGSAYAVAPTITITDPSNLYDAPTSVRIGNGACANASFISRGTGYDSALVEQDTGDGYADNYQDGQFMAVRRLTGIPEAGANVVFSTQPNTVYKLVQVLSQSGSFDGARRCFLQISPDMSVFNAPADGTSITTRIRYSQVRLTGHDFLDIGTGGFTTTNYPNEPLQSANQFNETVDNNGGRVFYTSTDQDGNFRVGELFVIEQATGKATLNADAFNIAGLSELSLGNITLGGNSATVTEFSTDPFLTANSDNVVSTQRAIKAYIAAQIGGGGASLNVNSIVAGFVEVAGTRISTTTGGTIQMKANFNFQAGVRGYPVAWNYFLNN